MAKAFLFFMLSLTAANCIAQKNPLRIWKTVVIDQTTAMRQTEVTVEEWMGFIASNQFDTSLYPDEVILPKFLKILFTDLKKKSGFTYLEAIKNKSFETTYLGEYSIRLVHNYERLKMQDTEFVFIHIPVTGISFAQANRFCQWKEDCINVKRTEKTKIHITLPSIELYRQVITNKDSLCSTGKCDSCKLYTFNFYIDSSLLSGYDKDIRVQGRGMVRVDAYRPTKPGLYNLQGNAAEMTKTEGIAMGGSFTHFARESFNDQTQKYTGPEKWLSFRYIATTVTEIHN